MREIKFRAWHTEREYMIPHKYISDLKKLVDGGYENAIPMQYTGLKDKHGKEIYEGDIYHLGDPNIRYVVVWNDTALMGKQIGSNGYAGLSYWRDKIELLGNSYENPELLERI